MGGGNNTVSKSVVMEQRKKENIKMSLGLAFVSQKAYQKLWLRKVGL